MKAIFTTYKTLTLSLVFLFLFSVTVSFAAPLYNTSNTTVDPQCLPSDPDCTVQQSLFTGSVIGPSTTTTPSIVFTSGVRTIVVQSGALEYDGTSLLFSPGVTRKRIVLSDDTNPAAGQLLIGNGTDYTAATLTAGTGVAITNGNGAITIASKEFVPNREIAEWTGKQYRTEQKEFITLSSGLNLIHGTTIVGDYLYATTRTSPANIIKAPLDNLAAYTSAAFPNDIYHNRGEDIAYSATTKKLYVSTQRSNTGCPIKISEIDPVTLAMTDIISDLGIPNVACSGYTALVADGDTLYVLSEGVSNGSTSIPKVLKYDIPSRTRVGYVDLNYTTPFFHSIEFDGKHIYVTSQSGMTSGMVLKIDPVTLTIVDSNGTFSGTQAFTDDFVFAGEYLFLGQEQPGVTGVVRRIKKSDLSQVDTITVPDAIGQIVGVAFDGQHVWVSFDTNPGQMARIDPVTLETQTVTLGANEESPNEILFDGQRMFLTYWTSPAKIARYYKLSLNGGIYNPKVDGTTKTSLTSDGNFGISADAPAYLLQVGNSTKTGIVARFENSAGTCDINPTTTSLTCSSDYRLKKNIVTLSNNISWAQSSAPQAGSTILDKVLSLQPVLYNWNLEKDDDTKHAGFIAQEVQQAFPDLVTTDPATQLLSLNYTGLLPYTIQALQEIAVTVHSVADTTKGNMLRDGILAWLSARTNGIARIFTGELCLYEAGQDPECVTRAELKTLKALLPQQAGGNSAPVPETSEPAPEQPAEIVSAPETPVVQEVPTETVPVPEIPTTQDTPAETVPEPAPTPAESAENNQTSPSAENQE